MQKSERPKYITIRLQLKVNKQMVSWSLSLHKSCFDHILSYKLIRFFNLLRYNWITSIRQNKQNKCIFDYYVLACCLKA